MNFTPADLAAFRRSSTVDPARWADVDRQAAAIPATPGDAAQARGKSRGGVAALAAVRVAGRMTKTEGLFAQRLDLERAAGLIVGWKYERINFKLEAKAGRCLSYRPDFCVWHTDGRVTFDEVKGGWISEVGMMKFRLAVDIFPEFHFRMWQWKKSVWTLIRQSEVKS